MSEEESIQLEISVDMPGADDNERASLAENLLRDVNNSDFAHANLVRGGTPEMGTKPGDVITWGSVAVAVLPTAVPSLITLIQAWVTNERNRTVKFKYDGIEFEGTREDLEKLLEKIEKDKGKKKKK